MKHKFVVIAVAGLAAFAVSAVCQDATRSVWDGVYTVSQAKRGQASYENKCASCHGDQLEGGNVAPPLSGSDFMSNWDGHTVGELFDRIHTTMPADHPGTLSLEDVSDTIAYILASNQFPAGDTELSHQSEALKQIRLDAKKPTK